jgi:hypothetical protein
VVDINEALIEHGQVIEYAAENVSDETVILLRCTM